MKNSNKKRVAILGASGAVGQELLSILAERKFPVADLRLLGSKRSAGKKYRFQGKDLTVEEATAGSFKNVDLVLSSAGGSVSKELLPHAVKAGALCVDNTSAYRMDPKVPLVIPEINADAAKKHSGIIANPNCSTIIMLMPLFPLHKLAKIRRIVVATYQSASGAGAQAMKELETQTRDILSGKKATKEVFPHQIAFNLFSHNSKVTGNGYCEEEVKMMQETKKILNANDIQVTATTVRVPVYRAHSEAIHAELEKPVTLDQVREALKKMPGIKIIDDREKNYFPMPIEASGKDDILVGRLRPDVSVKNGFAMFVSGDQLRKGAALNAVQIAELF